jgi:hypothetical protein
MPNTQIKMPDAFSFYPAEWSSWKKPFERYWKISDRDESSEEKQVIYATHYAMALGQRKSSNFKMNKQDLY